MNRFKVIAFSHKNIDVPELSRLHLEDLLMRERLTILKNQLGFDGLMLISTCNRCEFLVSSGFKLNPQIISQIFQIYRPDWNEQDIQWAVSKALLFEGEEAFSHLFSVASSIDSMVVGEREIITQVRNAFEQCKSWGLTDDIIRIAIKKTIETAKEVYTQTHIASKPVSVVSLAYRRLRDLNVKNDARFIFIGAGVTNTAFAQYLKKHGYSNFWVYNRTLQNAEKLAKELNGKAFSITELNNHKEGFDVIVTCTSATTPIITRPVYETLLKGENSKKIVIDLAVPNDLDLNLLNEFPIHLISVENLKTLAETNLREREKEISHCMTIINHNLKDFKQLFKERMIEVAMSKVPEKVKEIKDTAINSVFAKEIQQMDEQSKEVLDKVIAYLEKKYISVPMKMAKEILIEESHSG